MSRNYELIRNASRTELPAQSPNGGRAIVNRHAAWTTEEGGSRTQPELLPVIRILRKHWRWSATFALAVVAGASAFVFLAKPVYEPIARIEVDSGNELFSLPGVDARSDSMQYAETQSKKVQSDQLAIAVIRKLGLDRNAEWSDGLAERQRPANLAADTDSDLEDMIPAEYRVLEKFRKALHVQRDNSSWLINVSFAAHDPKLAALVTNTLVADFIQRNYKTRNDAIKKSTQWLSHHLDDLRQRIDESNRAVAEFQKTSGITPVGNSRSSFDERMSELNRQYTLAQAERIQLESMLAMFKEKNPDTLPQLSADPVVQELSKKLDATRTELKQTLVIYGKSHPKTKQLQAQIDELGSELSAQQSRVIGNVRSSFGAAHARENLLTAELKNATKDVDRVAQYEALKKEAQANEDLYNSLYAKVKEAAIAAEAKTSNIRWVDRAPVLDRPTRPRRVLDISVAFLVGIFGGILVAFVRESFDTRLHTMDDVRYWTGLASVSLMPLIGSTNGRLKGKAHSQALQISPQPFLLQRPNSPEAEALRGLFTSVSLCHPAGPPQVLLIASALPAEGKTTIAANLAIALARSRKTCIVDADLRMARLAKVFSVEHEHGLADVLGEYCGLDDALVPVLGIPNLTLLPGGPVPDEPGELISAERMGQTIRELRQKFQCIVIDSPPILLYADARVISPSADGIILVGRSGVTTREAIQRSLELLQAVHSAPVLDVVLNAVPNHSPDYSSYYKYSARS